MELLYYFVLFFYTLSIVLIFIYGLAHFNLLINYLKSEKKVDTSEKFNFENSDEIPNVTIQLPIFNEKYVVERLLLNIVKLDYPKDKLEIQVLDDSTDDSTYQTKKLIDELQKKGNDIKHVTRKNRTGFKAGALKEGLVIAKGEYIAIFDADFVPQKEWLLQTIPYFKNKQIGVVQTRWGHLNRDFSTLTKIQAFALDAHFTLEQVGRNSQSHFINFNGTAGVWRKECIIDAGNWESDTLTEDLDLSYRAQLKNWKFKYLVNVVTPAELPIIISAARSQQFRWNKGGAENFIKMISRVIKSENSSVKTKLHGALHLLNSSMFLCIFIMALLSVPMLYLKNEWNNLTYFFDALALFFSTSLLFFISYWFTFKNIQGGGFLNFIRYSILFFTFFSIAMGFSLHNSIAVLEGLFGKKSAFIRTPKFNVEALKEKWTQNVYIAHTISKNVLIEGFLILYFLFGLLLGFYLNDFGFLPLHLMLLFGFSFVFYKSIKDA